MSKRNGAVLIMAGGTGGHIFPGLAVAETLRQHQVPVHWLGAKGGMECQYVPSAGFEIDLVEISGIRGKGLIRWLQLPLHLFTAIRQAFSIIGKHRPVCALSFGGYAAGPGGLAARLRGVPLLVHEQNRIPGLTNRVLARLAKRVFQAFPQTWPDKMRAISCGNPVRQSVTDIAPPEQRWQQRSGRPRLLITGGSQGAQALNRVLPQAIAQLAEDLVPEIRHQAGKGRSKALLLAYEEAGLNAEVSDFIEDMAQAYAWADLVVCRAGALTVSELAEAGIGSVLVPFPYAVDDHQTHNARFLVDAGAAHLLPQSDCSPEAMGQLLQELLGDRSGLLRMASLARSMAIPGAAQLVARECMVFQRQGFQSQ